MLIYEAPAPRLDRLEEALARAFRSIVAASGRGEAVVVVVEDRDLQGCGDPSAAAFAHGLLGLVRALALEGRGDGPPISMIAPTEGVSAEERAHWLETLGRSAAASGSLLRLGGGQLGRLPT
jgi:hypothetical protein